MLADFTAHEEDHEREEAEEDFFAGGHLLGEQRGDGGVAHQAEPKPEDRERQHECARDEEGGNRPDETLEGETIVHEREGPELGDRQAQGRAIKQASHEGQAEGHAIAPQEGVGKTECVDERCPPPPTSRAAAWRSAG